MLRSPTVCVLAGGKSTRMGSHKPDVVVAGRPMLEWVLLAANRFPTLVVGGPELSGVRWVADGIGAGPAGALALALSAVEGPVILVAADQPWTRGETLAALASLPHEGACVPIDRGARQVTCARYPAGAADIAAQVAGVGGGLQQILDLVPRTEVPGALWRSWGEDGRSWFGVDVPADLATGLDRFGPPDQ